MPHVLEPASSGRAKCRGCNRPIAREELRFGERFPNPFGDGESTFWFHPLCAAYKRPEALLQMLGETAADVPDRQQLDQVARRSLEHPRLQRIDGAERARGGQAKCRHCGEPIAKASWRIRLAFYDEGRFSPGGFIHFDCRAPYFDTAEVLDAVLHFSPELTDDERAELTRYSAAP